MPFLYEKLAVLEEAGGIEINVPEFIKDNLKSNIELRPYQINSLSKYFYYRENRRLNSANIPQNVLFNMATGSGKTVMMAALILYLYDQGYRNFLFFVNNTTILDKTKENFLNKRSIKYLFNDSLNIHGKKINIKEVTNFEYECKDDINIVFTTIQGLHSQIHNPVENGITIEDFEENKIVLISDEAHHINADTKALSSLKVEEKKDKISWEETVLKVFNASEDNMMLEFTATIDLENEGIKNKYENKLVTYYPLKEFRKDRYSKDIETIQIDDDIAIRMLNACILSQYRFKIAQHNRLSNFKPTILMKSKSIKESEENEEVFDETINNLTSSLLDDIELNAEGIIKKAFDYFKSIDFDNEMLVNEIKQSFSGERIISVNSKNDTQEKQIQINSLEDPNNDIRIIFAVDKLNEGWDVLNLFDIVRLYDTRDSGRKIGKTTMSEAQLIGRGARYCPFTLEDYSEKHKRKFDTTPDHELRILETLYYHCKHNPRYIDELKKALIETGIKDQKERQFIKVKDNIKETDFWKKGKVFLNKRIVKDRSNINSLEEVLKKKITITLNTGTYKEASAFGKEEDSGKNIKTSTCKVKLSKIDNIIIKKAMNKLPYFYNYSNLNKIYPAINSVDDFIKNFLSYLLIEVTSVYSSSEQFSRKDLLDVLLISLEEFSININANYSAYEGTRQFNEYKISEVFSDEYSLLADRRDVKDMTREDWFVYKDSIATSEEASFIEFIDNSIVDLRSRGFLNIYLARSEKFFKIFSFEEGKAFQPDFVLFMNKENGANLVNYQVFVEPKGDQFKDKNGTFEHSKEGWKNRFLKEIESLSKIIVLYENNDYKLLGLPFFNEVDRSTSINEFDMSWNSLIK